MTAAAVHLGLLSCMWWVTAAGAVALSKASRRSISQDFWNSQTKTVLQRFVLSHNSSTCFQLIAYTVLNYSAYNFPYNTL